MFGIEGGSHLGKVNETIDRDGIKKKIKEMIRFIYGIVKDTREKNDGVSNHEKYKLRARPLLNEAKKSKERGEYYQMAYIVRKAADYNNNDLSYKSLILSYKDEFEEIYNGIDKDEIEKYFMKLKEIFSKDNIVCQKLDYSYKLFLEQIEIFEDKKDRKEKNNFSQDSK